MPCNLGLCWVSGHFEASLVLRGRPLQPLCIPLWFICCKKIKNITFSFLWGGWGWLLAVLWLRRIWKGTGILKCFPWTNILNTRKLVLLHKLSICRNLYNIHMCPIWETMSCLIHNLSHRNLLQAVVYQVIPKYNQKCL